MWPPPSTRGRRPAAARSRSRCAAAAQPPPSWRSRSRGERRRDGTGGRMRLLIVEDDREAAEAMSRGLAEAGHEPVVAADGEAGFKAAHDGRFDVMVVDRMLP